jgi:hypothetical protein
LKSTIEVSKLHFADDFFVRKATWKVKYCFARIYIFGLSFEIKGIDWNKTHCAVSETTHFGTVLDKYGDL